MFERVDALGISYLRIIVGVFGALWACSFLVDSRYDVVFLQPRVLLKYGGWEWVKLWPGTGIYWHFVITLIACLGLILGLLARVCAAVLCLSITYVMLVERNIYANHYYLLACTAGLLVFLSSSGWWALDKRLGARFGNGQRRTCWRWQLWLVRFQLAVPFVFAAIARLDTDWFQGQPIEIILGRGSDPLGVGDDASSPLLIRALMYGVFAFELFIIPLLLVRATRWIAGVIAAGVLLSYAVFLDLGAYPWFLISALPVFLPPAAIRQRLHLFLGIGDLRADTGYAIVAGHSPAVTPQKRPPRGGPRYRRSVRQRIATSGFVFAVAYTVIQLIVPLRAWIYPGDSIWNERGYRFSWSLLVRDKQTLTHFLLIDEAQEEFLVLPIASILTNSQAQQAELNPELVRQAAVQLATLAKSEFGVSDCRIHALALVSLNGRRPVPIIDPQVDLTTVSRGLWADDWVIEDPGELQAPTWREPTEQWWKLLELPEPFRQRVQGRTPSELDAYLRQLREQPSN